jgi:hypothetical protein
MSRYRVGINAGPVHVSRRVGGKGILTRVLVWWIVKPLELLVRGLARTHIVRRSATPEHRTPVATHGWFSPPATRPGWYDSAWGPLYFSGSNWYGLDGRPMF